MIAAGVAAAASFIGAFLFLARIASGPHAADRLIGFAGAMIACALAIAAVGAWLRDLAILDAAIVGAVALAACAAHIAPERS